MERKSPPFSAFTRLGERANLKTTHSIASIETRQGVLTGLYSNLLLVAEPRHAVCQSPVDLVWGVHRAVVALSEVEETSNSRNVGVGRTPVSDCVNVQAVRAGGFERGRTRSHTFRPNNLPSSCSSALEPRLHPTIDRSAPPARGAGICSVPRAAASSSSCFRRHTALSTLTWHASTLRNR